MTGGYPGPAPKPTQLRLIDGDRKDRINAHEPHPTPGRLHPPDGMSDEVRVVWHDVVRELRSMGIEYPSDRDALACYCEAVITHRKACQLLAVSPILLKGIHGNMVRNPVLQVQRDAAQTIRAFAQEFGLTPSARSRIEANKEDDDDGDNPFAGATY